MRADRQMTSRIAVALAMAALMGASAFADSRPAKETRGRGEGRSTIRREGAGTETRSRGGDASVSRAQERRSTERRGEARTQQRDRSPQRTLERDRREQRNVDSDRATAQRRGSYERYPDRRPDARLGDNRRNDSRSYGSRGRSYGNRQPYFAHGRVSRVHPYRGGFRVWIAGAPYPFFVPHAYYHRDRFRIGLDIRLGGYYNPLGYYDYYDAGYYDRGYGRGYSSGELRGIVESVDFRRDTFVIRNEATGSFVTVVMRDRRGDVRPGDYVELEGNWTRAGVFQAYDVDFLDDDRDYRR